MFFGSGAVLKAIESSRKESNKHNQELRLEMQNGFKDIRDSAEKSNQHIHNRISQNSKAHSDEIGIQDGKIQEISKKQSMWSGGVLVVSALIAAFGESVASKLGIK